MFTIVNIVDIFKLFDFKLFLSLIQNNGCQSFINAFYVEQNNTLAESARKSLDKLKEIKGTGGLIAIDRSFNFISMATASDVYMPVSYMPKGQ